MEELLTTEEKEGIPFVRSIDLLFPSAIFTFWRNYVWKPMLCKY